MTQPQPGWYPDPADAARQRYWAGDAWTAETRNIETTPATDSSSTPATTDPYANYAATAAVNSAPQPVYTGPAMAFQPAVPMTADGVPLAGWWWRVLASLLDSLVLGVVGMICMFAIPNLLPAIMKWANALSNMIVSGNIPTTLPSMWDPSYGLAGPYTTYMVITMAVQVIYAFVMLHNYGNTLGQLACGLRVVPLDQGRHPKGLPLSCNIKRLVWYTIVPLAINSAALFIDMRAQSSTSSVSTLLTYIGTIYFLVFVLRAAFDSKRQGFHDKIAGTQVIRIAR